MRFILCVLIFVSSGVSLAQTSRPRTKPKATHPAPPPPKADVEDEIFVQSRKMEVENGGSRYLNWSIEAEFELPIQFGGKLVGRTQKNIYGSIGAGFGPEFLMSALGSFAGNANGVGKQMGMIIADALVNSLVLDARMGWAFQGDEGLFAEVGYLMMSSQGGRTDRRNLEEALGYPYLLSDSTKARVDATVHAATFHAGYTIKAADSFYISMEGGVMKPVAVASNVKIEDPFDPVVAESRRRDLQTAMDKAIMKMFVPTIGIRGVYMF